MNCSSHYVCLQVSRSGSLGGESFLNFIKIFNSSSSWWRSFQRGPRLSLQKKRMKVLRVCVLGFTFTFYIWSFSWKITILSCFLVISSPAALYLPFSLNNPFQFWLHNLLWQTIPNHTKPNQILTKFHNNDQILQSQQKFIIQISIIAFFAVVAATRL